MGDEFNDARLLRYILSPFVTFGNVFGLVSIFARNDTAKNIKRRF